MNPAHFDQGRDEIRRHRARLSESFTRKIFGVQSESPLFPTLSRCFLIGASHVWMYNCTCTFRTSWQFCRRCTFSFSSEFSSINYQFNHAPREARSFLKVELVAFLTTNLKNCFSPQAPFQRPATFTSVSTIANMHKDILREFTTPKSVWLCSTTKLLGK